MKIKLKEMLTDITQLPWRPVAEDNGARVLASVRVPRRRRRGRAKETCIGRMDSVPDARYGCHAANLLPDVVQALRLLVADQRRPKSELSRAQHEFCETALERAENLQIRSKAVL